MMGRNHILSGAASTLALGSVARLMACSGEEHVKQVGDVAWSLLWDAQYQIMGMGYVAVIVAGVVLGSLLPDLDHDKSMLGRFVHINVPHRTWTHAIWWPILLFCLSFYHALFFWIGFGWLMHEVWDNLSKAGVCFFYPVSRPVVYARNAQGGVYRLKDGAKAKGAFRIKKHHKLWLYRAGKTSEYVVTYILCGFSTLLTAFTVYSTWP